MGSDLMKGLGIGLLIPHALSFAGDYVGSWINFGGYLNYMYIALGALFLFLGFKD